MLANPTTPSFTASQRSAGDALRPGQPDGTRLELTGDERCSPEHPDDAGYDHDDGVEQYLQGAVVLEEGGRRRRAVAVCRTGGDGRVVQVDQVRAGDSQDDGHDDQSAEDDRRLGAELEPGKPAHRRTTGLDLRARSWSRAWPI